MRRAHTLLLLLGLGALALGCVNGSTDSTNPLIRLYGITTTVQQASSYPAGTIMSVPIHVTYNSSSVTSGTVHWSIAAGKGAISDTTSTVDTLGATHILWTLGSAPGDNALVIGIGDATDTLHVTGVVGTASYLDRVGAQVDTIAVGASFVLQVVARDRPGNPVAGVTINWSSSGGKIAAVSGTSDATGTSSASFSAGTPGTYNITADLPTEASMFYQVIVR